MSDPGDSNEEDTGIENIAQLSPGVDSEYDEYLAMPESLSVISIGGEPVLVEGNTQTDSGSTIRRIPFNAVHHEAVKFSSSQRNVFIPGEDIKVMIINNERNVTTHLLNPNLYTIQFQHGEFSWTVKKRYKHFQFLHQQLRLFRASLNIPFPTKTHKERRHSFRNTVDQQSGKNKSALPRFPNKPDALVPFENLNTRIKQLEDYLYNLLNISVYRNHEETLSFLEVSYMSFMDDLCPKGKEGYVQKRTGSTQPGQTGCNCLGFLNSRMCVRCNFFCNDILCGQWRKRWFFIKDSCFGYIHPKDGRIKCVMLFDQGFEVSTGMYSTGLHHGLQIMTLNRQLTIKCWTRRKSKEWMHYLKDIAHKEARDFTHPNRYCSFAPVRQNVRGCWFVDGAGYMARVADALEAATEEIFIADWWLSPEIYMKRPAIDGEYWRLDKILQRKAQQGVKVFVLLYKEVEMALGINSFYSKQTLVSGHPDSIKVLRHPDHAKVGVLLWAHHEKIVVVDQTYAFLGGIDLCYGRWDDHQHRLTDLGSLKLTHSSTGTTTKKKTSSAPTDTSFFPSKPLPIHPPPLPEPDIIISSAPEAPPTPPPLPQLMPGDSLLITQPINEHMKCNTPEFERRTTMFDKIKDNVMTKGKDLKKLMYFSHETDEDCVDNNVQTKEEKHEEFINTLDGSAKLWIGKDYTNFIVKDFNNLDAPYADLVDRTTTPRMPWHDIGVFVQGAAARDVSRHFIQRWNATKLEKARQNPAYPYLVPKSYKKFKQLHFSNLPQFNVSCQVLRSVSCWSCGFLDTEMIEQSIHEAYVDAINNAQHYIYIENQFFITLNSENGVVRNQLGDTLFKRILRAHRENAVFRVYVVMPLLPGFEGEVGGATGTALHAITHWNYASISNGKHAILNRLKEAGVPDPSQYITFYGLRTHSLLNGEPITELIYVHSKLMIVDDKTVICGSSNINDRSMLGKRDSEIAVMIEDEEFEDGLMNGEYFQSGKYAGSLRKYLFKEHLGLLSKNNTRDVNVVDPVSDEFYKDVWYKTAELNTEFYEKVFHCIPSDKVDNFTALKKYQEEPPLYHTEVSRASIMLESIEGHLVLLPLNFLRNEVLTPSGGSVESIMPTSLWT